ncbi:ABC transporter substrate-binding protein [Kitasatospora sp. NPDC003701]
MSSPSMNRRDALKLFGFGTLAAAGLAACAPSGSSPTGGDKQSKDFGFTSWSLNEATSKAQIQQIVTNWESSNQSKITTTAIPFNEYLQQLTLKLNGGQVTGAVQLDIAWLAAIAQTGKLVDLTSVASRGGYTEAGLKSGQYTGVQFGLPWTTGAIGLIGNRALLEKAGARQQPTTIAAFEDALRALKELPGVTPYAASTKVAQMQDLFPWMKTFGCPVIKDSGTVSIGDDASIDAVTWYKKLYDAKLIAPDVGRADARALFGRGTVGFYDDAIVGKAATLATAQDKDALAAAMAPFSRPVLKAGDTPQALLWGHVLVVTQGPGSDAATRFALHTSSDQGTVTDYFAKLGLPPTTKAGLADPKVTSDAFTSAWTAKITSTATPGPFWSYAKNAQIIDAVAQQVQAVLVGQATPKDAMQKAGDQVRTLIKG